MSIEQPNPLSDMGDSNEDSSSLDREQFRPSYSLEDYRRLGYHIYEPDVDHQVFEVPYAVSPETGEIHYINPQTGKEYTGYEWD